MSSLGCSDRDERLEGEELRIVSSKARIHALKRSLCHRSREMACCIIQDARIYNPNISRFTIFFLFTYCELTIDQPTAFRGSESFVVTNPVFF